MEFWGVEVRGGEPLQCYPGEEYLVHVSQACLGEKNMDKGNEPVYIYAEIDGKKFVIGTLSHDKFPQSVLHLVFEKEFELSHTGKNASVHFTGYKVLKQDDGLLTNILQRLGTVEILTRAQHVCPMWRRICREPFMWKSIDIRGERHSCGKGEDLWKLCVEAVNRSDGGLLDVTLVYFAGDDVLRYIADRSSLRSLRLVECAHVSDKGLIGVARMMPNLRELDLSNCWFSSEAVAAVGGQCPKLVSFKLNARKYPYSESDDEALAIAKSMPGLHHLQIFGNRLTNAGLVAILDGCKDLKSLDLRRCYKVDLSDEGMMRRCSERRFKDFRLPLDSHADYPLCSDLDEEMLF